MRNNLLVPLIFFLLLSFYSCNTTMDKPYSAATYLQDIKAIRESNKVAYSDIDLLTKYIAISKMAGNDLQGKTYTEILEKIKGIRQANTDKSDKLKMEKDAMRERLNAYLAVTLSEKTFSKVSNKDVFTYTIIFQNRSAKNIKLIVGSISLNDLLDREIKNVPIVLDEELQAHASLKKIYTAAYNPAEENDKHIRTKDLVDLRILWNPEKIIFEDGTIAE